MMGLVLYNTACGIYQALGDSRRPLFYLIISSLANVIMDFLFVAVFDWGVGGAALATVLGQLLSAILAFAHLMSGKFVVQIKLRRLLPDRRILGQVFRLGLPSGVQNSVIAFANVIVQSHINGFGDAAMAGCGSYSKIEGFVFLPIMSLTMAMTTFIGQNLGAQQPDRARSGARQGTIIAVILAELIGVVVFIFAPQLIGIFSKTEEILNFGVRQARVESLFFCFLAMSHCCAAILRGCGRTTMPMMVMLLTWCLLRIVYITVVLHFIYDITVVFTAYPLTWSVSTIIFIVALKKKDWTQNAKL